MKTPYAYKNVKAPVEVKIKRHDRIKIVIQTIDKPVSYTGVVIHTDSSNVSVDLQDGIAIVELSSATARLIGRTGGTWGVDHMRTVVGNKEYVINTPKGRVPFIETEKHARELAPVEVGHKFSSWAHRDSSPREYEVTHINRDASFVIEYVGSNRDGTFARSILVNARDRDLCKHLGVLYK